MAGSTAGGGQAGQEGGCRPIGARRVTAFTWEFISHSFVHFDPHTSEYPLVVRGFMFVKNFFAPSLLDGR